MGLVKARRRLAEDGSPHPGDAEAATREGFGGCYRIRYAKCHVSTFLSRAKLQFQKFPLEVCGGMGYIPCLIPKGKALEV